MFGKKRKLKKQENIDLFYTKEFQGRLGYVDKHVRPVVKALQKQTTHRTNFDNEQIFEYFRHVQCFTDLEIGYKDILRVINVSSL